MELCKSSMETKLNAARLDASSSRGNRGNNVSLCSFLTANVQCEDFGCFRVPIQFHEKFGQDLPKTLLVSCKTVVWHCKYDALRRKIRCLGTFVKFYDVRMLTLIQFDYYGDGIFCVKIFDKRAIEIKYPSSNPNDFKNSEAAKKMNKEMFLIQPNTVSFQKTMGILLFNAFRNKPTYVARDISILDLSETVAGLRMGESMELLYKNWTQDSSVLFQFFENGPTWEVKVECTDGVWSFCDGWLKFAKEAELEAGDQLIMYKLTGREYIINICIFKKKELDECDYKEGGIESHMSFFKCLSTTSLEYGLIFLPQFIKNHFTEKLDFIKKLEVGGQEWDVFYYEETGCMHGFAMMFKFFNIKKKDTVVFNLNERNIMEGRVYGKDGMEIDYQQRPVRRMKIHSADWIWKLDFPVEDEDDDVTESPKNEEKMDIADVNNRQVEFTATLSKCHVDKKTHGLFIPSHINPESGEWTKTKDIKLVTDDGEWPVGIVLNNGRARFCAGWNKFVDGNKLRKNQTLHFAMVEENDQIIFHISK